MRSCTSLRIHKQLTAVRVEGKFLKPHLFQELGTHKTQSIFRVYRQLTIAGGANDVLPLPRDI